MNIIDRVKYDGPNDVFAWRWPHDGLVWGTQVIVNQSQEAVFYKDGKFLDVLAPGRHTLKSANIPLLEHLVNIPFGNETPFAAEVYYVNKAINLDMKWGTQEPIPILDPLYNVFLPVRAFGQFGIKITDAKRFLVKLVGTVDEFTSEQISEYFRGHLMSRIKNYISAKVSQDKLSILEISAHLNDMSAALQQEISDEFAQFGISIVNFYLSSINVPQKDESVIKLKEMLANKAEFELYGDNYNTLKMFDVAEKSATNEGDGNVAGAGVGMGVGMGIGNQMANMANDMQQNSALANNQVSHGHQTAQPLNTATKACHACQTSLPTNANFCHQCGEKQQAAAVFCTQCGHKGEAGSKFCAECGHKH